MSGFGDGNDQEKNAAGDQRSYSHIKSLLRALHQPNVNVSRPEAFPLSPILDDIEETMEEPIIIQEKPATQVKRPSLPVLFDIESVSETSSNNPSPQQSSANLKKLEKDTKEKDGETAPGRKLEENLERFNKNILNVMDSLMKTRADSPTCLSPSASTGKPFAFYHRMHRHSSAHSLNIPNIVVTGSDQQQQHNNHNHHLKRFSFGLRRHSHAVVGIEPTNTS